ncbi:hypothetical protein V5799_014924 [Amblyomma americanum]|uniref:Protein kinase domain-containing protein n=1 Tax=Amblyomma americanum TaxID=6943 RepID=A0AAQ4E1M7_AMBAM
MALSLAIAEEALEFEHRDLHLGHILVKRTTEERCWFRVGGRSFVIKTCGLEANVVGYSWARITDGGKSVFTAPTNLYGTSSDHNLLFVYKKMAAIVRCCFTALRRFICRRDAYSVHGRLSLSNGIILS